MTLLYLINLNFQLIQGCNQYFYSTCYVLSIVLVISYVIKI